MTISIYELEKDMTNVNSEDLESVVGDLFGGLSSSLPLGSLVPPQKSLPTGYVTPSFPAGQTTENNAIIFPSLPTPGSYTPGQASSNLGIFVSDGKGNSFDFGPNRASYQNYGNGVGIEWNSDAVGVTFTGRF